MQRERLRTHDVTTEDLNKSVRAGIVTTQSALFDFCSIAKDRIEKLTKVTTIIEDKLLSPETLSQIKGLPWQNQLPVYEMLNKIVGDMTGFLHKMHSIASDGARTEYLKKAVNELTDKMQESENKKKFNLSQVDPENISKVVHLLEYEMKRRMKKAG